MSNNATQIITKLIHRSDISSLLIPAGGLDIKLWTGLITGDAIINSCWFL